MVQNLKEWINTLLLTSLRDIIKSYSLEQFKLEDRERIISKITAKVAEGFSGFGLSLETFNVIGLEAPEGYVNLEPIKSITRAIDDKDDFDQLIIKKQNLNERIKELEGNIKKLEDDLLNDVISEDKFNEKIKLTKQFIAEAEAELEKINESISKSEK